MSDCTPRVTAVCDDKPLVVSTDETIRCPALDICLPFGGRLFRAEGGCLTHEPGTPPPDGIYSKIVIENGCITEAHVGDIPVYTPTPCAAVPTPCDGDSGDLPSPSPTAGNLFQYDASGRPLVRVVVQNGAGISVTGDGTASNPLVIANTQQAQERTIVQPGNAAIQVTGSGISTDPYRVAHVQALGGTQGLYTFDDFGHLIGFTPSSTQAFVTGIVEGDGIRVEMNPHTGIATVSLADPTSILTGVYRLGGWSVELHRNRIVDIQRVISLAAGTYRLGNYDTTVDSYGSIEDLVYVQPPSEDPTLVRAAASKRFVTSEETRTMTFTTEKAGAFRVMYQAASVPTDMVLFINNINIQGFREATRFNAIAPAIYAAGTHTITIESTSGFAGEGYLDMFLTVVAT